MNKRYILQGIASGNPISRDGFVFVHNNPYEMAWLFEPFGAVKVREVGPNFDLPTIPIKDLPEFEGVTWPLDRREFALQ